MELGGGCRAGEAPPPSFKWPISERSAAGSAINNNGLGTTACHWLRRGPQGGAGGGAGSAGSASAPPLPGYPGYLSGSSCREGLWKLLLRLQRLGSPRSAGRRDTLALGSPPDCTLRKYPGASRSQPAGSGCAPEPSLAGVKVQFPLKTLVRVRLSTPAALIYLLLPDCT